MIPALALIAGLTLFLLIGGPWALAIGCAVGGAIWTYLIMKD